MSAARFTYTLWCSLALLHCKPSREATTTTPPPSVPTPPPSTPIAPPPPPTPPPPVVDASAPLSLTGYALLHDGVEFSFAAWLSDGTVRVATTPPPATVAALMAAPAFAGLRDVQSLSSSALSGKICVLLRDGSVRCTTGSSAQLTGETPSRFEPFTMNPASVAREIAVGDAPCFRLTDGQILCGASGRTTLVPGLRATLQLASAGGTSCVLDAAHRVACWGNNTFGQLGDRTRRARATPAPVAELNSVAELSMSHGIACARMDDGSVACWGAGIGAAPVALPGLQRAVHVYTAAQEYGPTSSASARGPRQLDANIVVLESDGAIRLWRSHGSSDQRSDEALEQPELIANAPLATSLSIAFAGGANEDRLGVCALLRNGSLSCWIREGEGVQPM